MLMDITWDRSVPTNCWKEAHTLMMQCTFLLIKPSYVGPESPLWSHNVALTYILSSCSTGEGRYRWRHSQVLKVIVRSHLLRLWGEIALKKCGHPHRSIVLIHQTKLSCRCWQSLGRITWLNPSEGNSPRTSGWLLDVERLAWEQGAFQHRLDSGASPPDVCLTSLHLVGGGGREEPSAALVKW